jgi:elongation factor 1-alpha
MNKNEILGISKQNRPPDAGMTFVPISGWAGSNLIDNKNFPWFKIPTLSMAMDYLWPDSATKMTRTDRWYSAAANRPLRLFVQEARQEGGNTTVIGVLACGSLTPGMKLQSDPGSNISQLLSFKRYGLDGNIEPGNLVQLTLSGSATGMVRGAVCSAADHEPAAEAASIIAEITVFGGAHSPLHAGSRMLLSCHTATIPCEVKKLVAVLNTRTGQKVEDFPPSLDSSNRRRGLVEITPLEPIAIEPCIEFSRIGRFALSYLAPAESEEYTEADYADMPVREELMQKGMIFKEEDGEVTAWPDGLVALGKVVEVVKKKAGPRV